MLDQNSYEKALELIQRLVPMKTVDSEGRPIYHDPDEIAAYIIGHLRANTQDFCVLHHRPHLYTGTHWQSFPDEKTAQNFFTSALVEKASGKIATDRFIMTAYKSVIRMYRSFFDTNEQILINLQNCVLSVKNGVVETFEHSPQFPLTHVLKYPYDPDATCPGFNAFLAEVLPADSILALQEFMGYALAGRTLNFEKSLFLYGTGSNGKSVLLHVLSRLYGEENISRLELQDLRDPNNRSMLIGKLVNIGTDSSPKGLDNSIFKKAVSGEPVSYKVLYQDTAVTDDLPVFMFAMNNMPFSHGETSLGFLRRMLVIPFEVTITDDRKDRNLASKLTEELSGIFNFALEGLFRLIQQNRFTESDAMNRVLGEFEKDINIVKRFVEDFRVIPSNKFTPNDMLYKYFKTWCGIEGLTAPHKRFMVKKLREMQFEQTHSNKTYGFRLELKPPQDIATPCDVTGRPLRSIGPPKEVPSSLYSQAERELNNALPQSHIVNENPFTEEQNEATD